MHSRCSARSWYVKALCALAALAVRSLFADTLNSGIALNLSCPAPGSNASGSATVTSGSTNLQATCQQVSTGYTKFALDTDSLDATTLSYLDESLRDHGEIYSFAVPNFMLIVPPFGAVGSPLYSKTPIYTVSTACPGTGEKTLNWIYVQFPTGQVRLTGTKLLGYASYDKAAESSNRGITVKGQWDLTGAPYFLGDLYVPGQCRNGVFNATGSTPNTSGTIYFNASGLGIFKTAPGSAIFFLPESPVGVAELGSTYGNQTYLGTTFDSANASSVRQVRAVSSADGMTFTVKPYSDPQTGQIDTSADAYKDVLEVKSGQANYPRTGFFLARVSRVVDGVAVGRGDVACMGHYSPTNGATIFCSGTHPTDNTKPFTLAINSPRTTPAPPSALQALNGQTTGSVNLYWVDGSINESAFEIQMSASGPSGPWTRLADAPASSTIYTVSALTPGATYYFQIRAVNGFGASAWAAASGQARASGTGLAPPTYLAAYTVSQSEIDLTWSASGSQYEDVLRSQDALNWETIATLAGTATSYPAQSLASGTKYYFRILAHNGTASTSYSNTASAVTLGYPVKAPSPITASATSTGIRVDWTPTASTTATWILERSLYGGSDWKGIGLPSPSDTIYVDANAFFGVRYYYRVAAVMPNGERSPYSAIVSAVSISNYNYAGHRNKLLADNPILYFNFDAASGNFVQDLTPNRFLGSLRGGSAFANTNTTVPFQKKTALNGTDGYLTTPDDLKLRLKTFSIEVWFRVNAPSTDGAYSTLLSKGSFTNLGQDENYQLHVHNTLGKLVGRIGMGSSAPEILSNVRVDDGNWHQGVFTTTHDPSSQRNDVALYVDGVLQSTGTWTGTPTLANGPLDLGVWRLGINTLYGSLNGDIGEALIYGNALSPSQVANHYSY